ncbi:DUF4157 domain-containing protein [Cellulomonas sp. McL0617]|uniref:eCIS core domain-containing protein n=1 Tax=Cellulomonas sp. McL0617 TaxID=3415675 RepID=UPI003CEB15E2
MATSRAARVHSREPLERARPSRPAVSVAAGPRSPFPISGLVHPVRRLSEGDDALGGTAVVPETASALERLRGAGARLSDSVAGPMGEAMGADLSGVRVHADSQADQISRSLQATAFTHGQDLYFTHGTYSPETPAGQRLLAHELAHVVQGRSGVHLSAAGAPTIGRAADPAEAAADAIAETALARLRRNRGTERVADAEVGAFDGAPATGAALAHEVARTGQQQTAPAIRRMTTTTVGKKKETVEVKTLARLNEVIGQLKIAGGSISVELIESKATFAASLTDAAVDKAVAESALEITAKLKQSDLITELVSRLKAPKVAPKQKDPLVLRTEAAKALKANSPDKTGGSYLCGKGDQPHVHLYADGFHLKKINGIERINVIQSNILYPDGIKKARQAATADPRSAEIHIAIDKCLLALKESLDTY